MAIIVVAFLLSTFLMYEGRGTRRTPGVNPDGSMSDYEVAQINGRPLMRSELERRLRDYLSSYSSRSAESLDMPAIYQAVLDQAILESQLAKEVEEKGIRVSDADADRAMKDYADRYYPTRETFYQALANSGVRMEDYRRSLARQMATEQVIREAIGEVVISEDQAVQFYETMKTLIYGRPEGYMLHIANFKTRESAEIMHAKLEAGEKWEDIVSSDVLDSNDIVNISSQPVFVPATAFEFGSLSRIASVDVGKASPILDMTSDDFAVCLKSEHTEASVRTYDEVSADVRTRLTNQEEQKRINDYEALLMNKAQVVINDSELFARPVVKEEEAPAVEDVIPELAETPAVSEEPAETETETQPEAETPEVVEEAQPEAETPAVVSETQPETETPAVVSETQPEIETPAVVDEAQLEPETPAVISETQPEAETPAVVEEVKTEADVPEVIETPAVEITQPEPEPETPAVVEEVITNSQNVTEDTSESEAITVSEDNTDMQ